MAAVSSRAARHTSHLLSGLSRGLVRVPISEVPVAALSYVTLQQIPWTTKPLSSWEHPDVGCSDTTNPREFCSLRGLTSQPKAIFAVLNAARYEFPARDGILYHSDTSAGNPRPCRCSGGLTPQSRATFDSALRPRGILHGQVLFSTGLASQPQPIFAVVICGHEIPHTWHVVDRGNHGGEGYLSPN